MRHFLLAVAVNLLFVFPAISQGLMPIQKGIKANVRDGNALTQIDTTRLKAAIGLEAFALVRDSVNTAVKKEEKRTKDEIESQLNSTSPISLTSSGGIANFEEVEKAFGNLTIGVQFRLRKNYIRVNDASNWVRSHYAYTMFNTKTNSSTDSSDLTKLFAFPALSKRDFVLGYYWQYRNDNGISIEPIVEVSLNRYNRNIDTLIPYADTTMTKSENVSFRSESGLIGVKLSKTYEIAELKTTASIQVFPYFNVINTDPKYWDDYRTVLEESVVTPHLTSFGFQTIVQVKSIAVFCDAKYILNEESLKVSSDFTRFNYTIGSVVTF